MYIARPWAVFSSLAQTARCRPSLRLLGTLVVLTFLLALLKLGITGSYGILAAINMHQAKGSGGAHAAVSGQIDWSRFAYTQYVTNDHYLCNSVMFFESLHRLGSKPDRVLMYPKRFDPGADDKNGRILRQARDTYGVKLIPVKIQRTGRSADPTWAESFTKLLAFNQTRYDRVLSLASDGIVLGAPDELFLMPSCPVAMPRAYWLESEQHVLSSQVILIEPSEDEFRKIQDRITASKSSDYDMEIVKQLYHDSALVLPHRKYDLLSAEFRREDHSMYLGNTWEEWDPVAAYKEANTFIFPTVHSPSPGSRLRRLRKLRSPDARPFQTMARTARIEIFG